MGGDPVGSLTHSLAKVCNFLALLTSCFQTPNDRRLLVDTYEGEVKLPNSVSEVQFARLHGQSTRATGTGLCFLPNQSCGGRRLGKDRPSSAESSHYMLPRSSRLPIDEPAPGAAKNVIGGLAKRCGKMGGELDHCATSLAWPIPSDVAFRDILRHKDSPSEICGKATCYLTYGSV